MPTVNAPLEMQINQHEIVSERSYRFQKHTVLVDSRMRDKSKYPTPSAYRIELPSVYKQVKTVRLFSAEVPLSFYAFTSSRGFTSLHVGIYNSLGTAKLAVQTITISDGNYTTDTIVSTLQTALNANSLFTSEGVTFTVAIDSVTKRVTLKCSPSRKVYVDTTSYASAGDTNWGLEYFLGFPKNKVTEGLVCSATSVVKLNPYNYMLLDIAEINGLDECGRATHTAFAKIPMNVNSFDVVMLSQDCCTYNTSYLNPYVSKLSNLTISWRMYDLSPIDFNDSDHSFTLELECLE